MLPYCTCLASFFNYQCYYAFWSTFGTLWIPFWFPSARFALHSGRFGSHSGFVCRFGSHSGFVWALVMQNVAPTQRIFFLLFRYTFSISAFAWIFERICEEKSTKKGNGNFESSKIDKNDRINQPWGAQGRLLGSLLASIFRICSKTAKV